MFETHTFERRPDRVQSATVAASDRPTTEVP
jgi:hypothetical protein